MKFDPGDLKAVLSERNVDALHHANTVATAASFLRSGKLLSRQRVEQLRLPQTAQKSDDLDKQFGIWDEVFVDSVDIHQRAGNRNFYGPVLFRINLNVLDRKEIQWVSITKKNPTNWKKDGEANAARWFIDLDEVKRDFVRGEFGQMIVLRCQNGELDISRTLEALVLDDPTISVKPNVDLYSFGLGALCLARVVGNLADFPIEKRSCPKQCLCGSFYRNTQKRGKVRKLFDPRETS